MWTPDRYEAIGARKERERNAVDCIASLAVRQKAG